MARKRAHSSASDEPQTPAVQTAPPLRRSTRSTRANEPVRDATTDGKKSKVTPKPHKKAKTTTRTPSHETAAEQSPQSPRYHTRSKQVQSLEADSDVACGEDEGDDVEELPTWPRYKDDLPNAFNGEVDPSQDFISKAPVEIIDNILSFLLLDHDPERGVKTKEQRVYRRPHALISMSAMSHLFYHATESFAYRFLMKNKEVLSLSYVGEHARAHPEHFQTYLEREEIVERFREERASKIRRSSRLAGKPQPEVAKVHRTELVRVLQSRCAVCLCWNWNAGKLANAVSMCSKCDISINGPLRTLTEALKDYDLRDYMLMKTRKPGPKAKFTDLPAVTYGSEYKNIGFPAFKTMIVFYFRSKDLQMLANLVHGDWRQHMAKKWQERIIRQEKAQVNRVRKFIIDYHERELEVSKGRDAKQHQKRLDKLRALAPDEEEKGVTSRFGCTKHYCYHDVGLCSTCGDVPGRKTEDCPECESLWIDRRFEQFYSRALGEPYQDV